MEPGSSHLPSEFADRFTQPFARFLEVEAATGALLAVYREEEIGW